MWQHIKGQTNEICLHLYMSFSNKNSDSGKEVSVLPL